MSVLHGPDELTPAWLTTVLRGSGALADDGAAVASFAVTPIGTGQMGDSFRVGLTYDGDAGAAPATVVIKFAAQDETSRNTGQALRSYEVEMRFYREVAARSALQVPRCHLAAIEDDGSWFTLVLGDLAPASQGDQIAGLSEAQVRACAVALAGLHGPCWEADDLAGLEWLNRVTPETAEFTALLISTLYPGFIERYGDQLSSEDREVCDRFIERLSPYLGDLSGPRTVVHGDYRADNLLFTDGGSDVTAVDWQTVAWGRGPGDVAYLVGLSFADRAERAAVEESIVREYHAALEGFGVQDYPWEACWRHYRLGAFTTLIMSIAPSMLVERTERGDEMFMTSLRRGASQIRDLGALALLP